MANLVPKVNNTGSLGTSAKKWSNIHTTTLSIGAQASDLSLNSQKITNLATPTAAGMLQQRHMLMMQCKVCQLKTQLELQQQLMEL